jgi:hypothetical protein
MNSSASMRASPATEIHTPTATLAPVSSPLEGRVDDSVVDVTSSGVAVAAGLGWPNVVVMSTVSRGVEAVVVDDNDATACVEEKNPAGGSATGEPCIARKGSSSVDLQGIGGGPGSNTWS